MFRLSVRLGVFLLGLTVCAAPAMANNLDLKAEEAAGGHTIKRHVARPEAALRERLVNEPSIPAASSFKDYATAETGVAVALRDHAASVEAWLAAAGGSQTLPFTHNAGHVVGYGVIRATGKLQDMRKVQVVLRKTNAHGRKMFLLTAYPVP